MVDDNQIEELIRRFRPEARITVLTGAGVSAASGVPTFRGAQGLWRNYPPEQLATADAFRRDPHLVWEWYNWRRELIARCEPNAAHRVLASWSTRHPGFRLITQNVDGLHEKAGTRGVIRFHGSIWEVLCWERCGGAPERWREETVPFPQIPPSCPYCGGLIRPGIVWFGEGIDPSVLKESEKALDCDLFLVIGTSSVVYPAAGLTAEAAARGAFTVEINPEVTGATSGVRLSIQGRAEVVLPELESRMVSRV
ncbi:MAG TPA: NAD-dependent deacylase [Acidobacteriota bacterium]|nr:NAD-dependent deacylase [Acidobacteriota bacterium]